MGGEKHELILTPEGDKVKLFELVYLSLIHILTMPIWRRLPRIFPACSWTLWNRHWNWENCAENCEVSVWQRTSGSACWKMCIRDRARTADWENGVLTLDGEKKFDIPELTTEIMEQLAAYLSLIHI